MCVLFFIFIYHSSFFWFFLCFFFLFFFFFFFFFNFFFFFYFFFFFQAEDGIRDRDVTGVQTCALPISARGPKPALTAERVVSFPDKPFAKTYAIPTEIRSEEHTSELQSHHDLVCR